MAAAKTSEQHKKKIKKKERKSPAWRWDSFEEFKLGLICAIYMKRKKKKKKKKKKSNLGLKCTFVSNGKILYITYTM